ncbi:peptidase M23 [Rhodococcoides trifolii]|uniref:Peptidase M23 n=1 Tax=Rhodococcoides trifolii TaxID=908250 RepID=A0A917FTX4_9NOCA|nr:peptidase M23 [Rhodococcus trifolii]
MTNFVSQPVTVQSITVSDGDTVLQNLTSDVLPEWTKVFGTTEPGTTFGPGQSGLVWIDAVVDSMDQVPDTLENRISVTLANPSPPILPASLTYSIAPVTVDKVEPVRISPPLRGERWVDGNGCCSVTAHRGAVSPLNGKLWAPERFAIDWVQLDAENRLFTGDKTSTASYPYFGDDVMAVADGRVVAVVDGLPEQTPGANPSGLSVDQYGGNHVVQDIGNGHYAFYAHLQTGSTSRVKVGDELKTGDVLGLLGNSGNTDSPHLHFHVMDGIDPLVSNGLPFEFESFDTTGKFASSDAVDRLLDVSAPAQLEPGVTTEARTNEMPMFMDVVSFPS